MPNRAAKMLQERMKGLKTQKHISFDDSDIETKISQLNSQIKNCENDLNGHFQGNVAIELKLNNLKQRKQELENDKRNKNI